MMYVLVILSLSAGAQPGNSVDFFSKPACEGAAETIRANSGSRYQAYCFPRGIPDTDSEIRKLIKPRSN